MLSTPWSKGHSGTRLCLGCGCLADCKPASECPEPQHLQRFQNKLNRNNVYRRTKRAEARAEGIVYRKGRGSLENKAVKNRERHIAFRAHIQARLGMSVCVRCGFADARALQIDHINGGGRKHRRALSSGTAYYRVLAAMSDTELRAAFQILCANCNVIKRETREEWRWKRASETPAEED